MRKSIVSDEYALFLRELREARKGKGLSQKELGLRIGETQSFVSKCERGERRIDVAEARAFCAGIGIEFPPFIAALERKIRGGT